MRNGGARFPGPRGCYLNNVCRVSACYFAVSIWANTFFVSIFFASASTSAAGP